MIEAHASFAQQIIALTTLENVLMKRIPCCWDFSVRKIWSYVICRVIIIGFIGENVKNSQNHLFGQLDRFSVLSSTKFAVRLIELPFTLQHDGEFVMFRFYFPLPIKLFMVLCVIFKSEWYLRAAFWVFLHAMFNDWKQLVQQ